MKMFITKIRAYVELEEADHMDFLEPASSAHQKLCQWLQAHWDLRT